MPELNTLHLGAIHYSPEDILTFPSGLPGFESHRQFVLLPHAERAPLAYLQSIEAPGLRFILARTHAIEPSYMLCLEPWDRAILFPEGLDDNPFDLSSYFIVCVPPDGSPTANMLAPIVIRWSLRRGVQAVRTDSRYSHAAPLVPGRSLGDRETQPC